MSALQLEAAAAMLGPVLDEPVVCRWRSREPQLVLDVMPTDPDIPFHVSEPET